MAWHTKFCKLVRTLAQFDALAERDDGGTFVRMSEGFDRSEIEHDDNGKYRWEVAFVKATNILENE
jgi:hypothetical protein